MIAGIFIFPATTHCQIPNIIHNYTKADSANLQHIDSFVQQQEYVFAYKEEGGLCRNCPSYTYKIIAYNKKRWSSFTYSNFSIQGSFNKKTKQFSTDTIRTGQLYSSKLNINKYHIQKLFDGLSAINFWILNNDSLNQTRKYIFRIRDGDTTYRYANITDDLNYRFDILFKNKARVIQSYAPEYFLSLFPDMKERSIFLKGRRIFLAWWDKYGS
jgi:hypothetical protein